MHWSELVLSAFGALWVNRLRSALTMLGIFIGVASIVVILAIGSGGQAAIVSTIESQRVQQTIQIVPTATMSTGTAQPNRVTSFTDADFNLANSISGVAHVYSTLYGQAGVTAAGRSATTSVAAGPAFLNEIGHFTVQQGRMFGAGDVIGHRPVALISNTLATQLFGHHPAVGQTITMNGHPLQVIGITLSTEGSLLSGILGSQYVYMPSTTCTDLFPWWTITEMDVQVAPGSKKAQVSRRVVTALNIRVRDPNAFSDNASLMAGYEQMIGRITTLLTLIIGAIAGIALVVGGVGVMNIMLVAVSERTREIGIRMAIGATRRAILQQFLFESAAMTSLGGGAGVVVGLVAAQVVRSVTHFPITVPWWAITGSLAFSIFIGVVCGLYPAYRAARLQPIEALRYE